MTLFLARGLPARQTRFLCLLAARPSLTRADYQRRLLQVSHNTAKPEPPDSGSGSGPYLAGSPGQELAPIGITIDPISLRRP